MLLVPNLGIQNGAKNRKMTKILANGLLSESIQWELSHEYQHDRAWTVFKNLRALVL